MALSRRSGKSLPIQLPAGLVLLALAGPVRAELPVFPPTDVAKRWITWDGDTAQLVVDGHRWELVTDPTDPDISQLGDGSFHPFDEAEVRQAIEDLGVVPQGLRGKILLLPFPRRGSLKSSCENGTIYLSPGIREVHPEHVHATVTHEVGHLVQRTRAPEGTAAWETYLRTRNLDAERFQASAPHADRPREIFAEDFRVLFGGSLATASGTQENPDLPLAWLVPGLPEWFDRFVREPSLRTPPLRPPPRSRPNPAVGPSGDPEVSFDTGSLRVRSATADIFDLQGRRVRILSGIAPDDDTVLFRWDRRDAAGRTVGSGVYFVRWRESPEAGTARVQVLH